MAKLASTLINSLRHGKKTKQINYSNVYLALKKRKKDDDGEGFVSLLGSHAAIDPPPCGASLTRRAAKENSISHLQATAQCRVFSFFFTFYFTAASNANQL